MAMAAAPLFNFLTRSPFTEKSAVISLSMSAQCRSMQPRSSLSSNNQPLSSEQAVLEAVANFDANEKTLPAVRTFENDLARLTVVGAVDFQQALTAAAADGGEAADEHISSGLTAMVVEIVYPGQSEDRSTVSTRLFLPARKVKEKAIKLKKSLEKEVLDGTMSKNILAMTFRQVVLQHLWSLDLTLFSPGSERNMNDLENPREVPELLNLSSSDERIVSVVAEVVCTAALESTERNFFPGSSMNMANRFFSLSKAYKRISSRDSSVVLYNLLEHEIIANAGTLLKMFSSERGKVKLMERKLKNSWWTSSAFLRLQKIGGPEFCSWISECVPSYMLEIDANKLSGVKFKGWKRTKENRWGIVLTHSQMVGLADILDMYYEDLYTLPSKKLSCYAMTKPSNLTTNKGPSLLKLFATVLVSGIFLMTISVLSKLHPHLPIGKKHIQENSKQLSSDMSCTPMNSVDPSELEACCVAIIHKLKDSYGWPGEIFKDSGACAWIGELPKFLRKVDDNSSIMNDILSNLPPGTSSEEMKALEDIASYQVVVSADWKIIGFQPTNRISVNNWASNPLARELYGGKNLSPGLIEPRLNIRHPHGGAVVALELLMSLNPNSCFALVRSLEQ
ncbi:uncharacterized protein LOC127259679 isoform X2 [Andrographis paniculata]|uniref:uncharacterized protein LOC127259679 isoform X2 n=1 Tax=Andrographis paniculata TaxID=175694 RepID=UPI0021E76FFB|nr:uncharacterized protein LOC127259679 isoform X2 [Andrographis paniculata]